MAPTAPLANVSTSNLAYNILNYFCTNFGAFIKKCTIRPKMAAYPLYYIAKLHIHIIFIHGVDIQIYMYIIRTVYIVHITQVYEAHKYIKNL